ncbi:MAG: xanthine dehydrogenase family protein subunit M [Candidatus Symbiobacter sp.]|nr:xanthine dehydrogenase family protein subunit M [Candidatus Symbiobacter sp.]
MIPWPFEYHAPKNIAEAINLLGQYGGEAKILAGGHSLLPMMKLRFAQPEHLIDLNRIPELRGIKDTGNMIVIGAMTVENDLIRSPIIQSKLPLLAEAAKLIADPQVRNRGTIGGDLAHGDPANDHPALALALQAQFVLTGPKGKRTVAAADFFQGLYLTALAENEVLTEIHVPVMEKGTGYAYEKLKRKTGDWATAGAAVVMQVKGNVISKISIALTNLAPTAMRAEAAESALLGKELTPATLDAAAKAVMAAVDPAEDLRGDVEYKTAMAGQMVKRALGKARMRCA